MSAILNKLLKGQNVEWLRIAEVGELVRGNGLQKSDFTESGVPAIHYGQIYTFYGNSTTETKSFVSPELAEKLRKVNKGDVVITNTSENLEDVGKALLYLGEKQAVTGGHATIFRPGEKILGKYFVYFTQSDFFASEKRKYAKGTKVIDVSATDMAKILIAIPPLDVQAEIVRILDAFTAVTAELNMREKQYQYYRNKLLSFSEAGIATDSNRQQQTALCEGLANNVKQNHQIIWKSLGEVVKMQAGKNIKASQIHPSQTDENLYPCFGGNGIRGYVNNLSHQGEYVIIGRQGALCGNVQRVKGNFYATEHAVVVTVSDLIDVDWAYHMLSFMNLNQYASKSAQPGLAVGKLEQLEIPVPNLSEQKRVAKILDKLDTITHSITEGLPKEINLRQRQYEYYREQLIDFPKN